MTSTSHDKRNANTSTADWVISAATLTIIALAGLGIWYWQDIMRDEGVLQRPTQTVRHNPENLGAGLDAYAARNRSPNQHKIIVTVKIGDISDWLLHFDNVAAHKGWYTPSEGRYGRKLILPGGQVNALWDAKDNPYGWLKSNQPPPGAEAKPLELGNYPAYVTLLVHQNVYY